MSFIKITEQNSLYNDLERKSVRDLLEDINTEDQKVALAVRETIPKIEELVLQIVPRMKQGGRIFYLGAGTSGRLGVLDASEIPPTFGMPSTLIVGLIAGGDTALRNPVENAEDDEERGWQELLEHRVNTKDTVIGIAASGTTPYVIGALRKAREQGPDCLHFQQSRFTDGDGGRYRNRNDCRAGVCHWQFPYEIRHGAENDPEHDLHLRYDPIG